MCKTQCCRLIAAWLSSICLKHQIIVFFSECLFRLLVLHDLCCFQCLFCTCSFIKVPLNLICLHILQHFNIFPIYIRTLTTQSCLFTWMLAVCGANCFHIWYTIVIKLDTCNLHKIEWLDTFKNIMPNELRITGFSPCTSTYCVCPYTMVHVCEGSYFHISDVIAMCNLHVHDTCFVTIVICM